MKRKHLLRIGRVRKPHGVRGKVSVYLFNDQSASLKENRKILVGADEETAQSAPRLTLTSMQGKGAGTVILAFREINSAEEAMGLRNASLYVVTCAYVPEVKRSYGWTPPPEVVEKLRAK